MTYAATQTSAAALIASKGQAVTLTVSTPGAYDPATGTVTLTTSAVATTGVVLPLSRGFTHMPGTNIQAGDQRLLLPGDIAQPALDTKASIGGKLYTIFEVNPLNPGGTNLIFDCLIRGAS